MSKRVYYRYYKRKPLTGLKLFLLRLKNIINEILSIFGL